jgi:hypothetical protein
MNLVTVMDQVGTQLDTISGLRVTDFPPDNINPPAGYVGLPEDYEFDKTYGRGMDRINNLPVIVAVSRWPDRQAFARAAEYAAGSGAKSVKAVLEAGAYSAFHTLTVTGVVFDVLTIGGTDYLGALFTLDITGQGSA